MENSGRLMGRKKNSLEMGHGKPVQRLPNGDLANKAKPTAQPLMQNFRQMNLGGVRTVHANQGNSRPSPQTCRQFLNTGNCDYGNKCRYAHEQRPRQYNKNFSSEHSRMTKNFTSEPAIPHAKDRQNQMNKDAMENKDDDTFLNVPPMCTSTPFPTYDSVYAPPYNGQIPQQQLGNMVPQNPYGNFMVMGQAPQPQYPRSVSTELVQDGRWSASPVNPGYQSQMGYPIDQPMQQAVYAAAPLYYYQAPGPYGNQLPSQAYVTNAYPGYYSYAPPAGYGENFQQPNFHAAQPMGYAAPFVGNNLYTGGYPTGSASVPPNYKTRLCRTFQTNGCCEYGNDCNFAHGSQELRQTSPPSSLKRCPSAPTVPATDGTPAYMNTASYGDLYFLKQNNA